LIGRLAAGVVPERRPIGRAEKYNLAQLRCPRYVDTGEGEVMKKLAVVLSMLVALLVFAAAPSHGQGHGGGGMHGGMHGGGGWHGGGSGGSWHGGGGGYHGGGYYGGAYHGGYYHGGYYGGGWHGAVYIGGPWWWGAYPYAYPYGYPYAYPYYYAAPYAAYPPTVVDQGPSVYIQQPVAPAEAAAPAYWYYCPSSKEYYPMVEKCRVAWVKVPPTPQ